MEKLFLILIIAVLICIGCINEKKNRYEENIISNKTSFDTNDDNSKDEKNEAGEKDSAMDNGNSFDKDIDIEELSFKLGEEAFDGNLDKVKEYLEKGADINYQDSFYGTTALYFALKNNQKEIAKYLIEHGADVNLMTYDRESPLSMAIIFTDFEMVKYLIEKGADVNAICFDNETALVYAVKKEKKDVISFLIDNGAEVNIKFLDRKHSEIPIEDAVEKTLLQYAKEKGSQEIIDILIEAGATE